MKSIVIVAAILASALGYTGAAHAYSQEEVNMFAPPETSAKFLSAVSPSFSPREVSHAPGQLPTIFSIFGSACQSINAATSSPATSFNAATISATLTDSPGKFTTGHTPSAACSSSQPAI